MKFRLILLVLSLLSFLSASVGGYLYYTSLRDAAFHEAERQALNRLVATKRNLSGFLSENVKPVRVLAGMKKSARLCCGRTPPLWARPTPCWIIFRRPWAPKYVT